jgi:Zn-dependent metalloprotease
MSAQRAYDSAGLVYYFYNLNYGRNSYDDKGHTIVSSVHGKFDNGTGSCDGNNAAWIGEGFDQMVYGDGDGFGIVLKDLTLGFDVTAHELTHAVTFATSNLAYLNDSGALNESMSDLFGATVEAWRDSGGSGMGNPAAITPTANTWKIGEAVAGFLLPGGALRFMNDPAADMASKDFYADRVMPGGADNGGVHFNSGIGNLAFYLMSAGGKHPRMKTTNNVTGIGIAKANHIFYTANTTLYTSMTDYQAARYATAQAAENLYGRCSPEWQTVHEAWDAVGVPGGWSLCVRPTGPEL